MPSTSTWTIPFRHFVAWASLAAAASLLGPSANAVLTLGQATQPVATAQDLAGVARLDNGCSAVLLAGGRHLLGAAHCTGAVGGEARFPALPGQGPVRIAAVALAPGWNGTPAVHDLALMTLESPVTGTPGARLATAAQVEAAPWVLMAGFGQGGTLGASQPAGQLHWGRNEYDGRMKPESVYGNRVALFDFDDGSFGANTLGLVVDGTSSLGLGADEAMLGGMDSGGPSLVRVPRPQPAPIGGWAGWLGSWGLGNREPAPAFEWRIAGIHAGIDGRRGSRPGGVGMDTLVAPYAEWIASIAGGQVLGP